MTPATHRADAGVDLFGSLQCAFLGSREERCLVRIDSAYVELPLADFDLAQIACAFPTDRAAFLRQALSMGLFESRAADFYDGKWKRLLAACSGSRASPSIRLQVTLLPEKAVVALARVFAPLFSPIALCVFTALLVWTGPRLGTPLFMGRPNAYVFAALTFAGVLLHELGHAAAAWRGGARPGRIGVGLYLIFPVAFSDVTHVWALPRAQRIRVNLGGIYFQAAFVLAVNAINLTWPFGNLTPFNIVSGFLMLHALNPCFRTDGYWLLADATRTRSPHRRISELVFGRADRGRYDLILLAGFSAASLLYIVYVVVIMIARPLAQLAQADYSAPFGSIARYGLGPVLLLLSGTLILSYLARQAVRSRAAHRA